MGSIAAWMSSASEDVSLLARTYLPELLVIALILVISWVARMLFHRERPHSR